MTDFLIGLDLGREYRLIQAHRVGVVDRERAARVPSQGLTCHFDGRSFQKTVSRLLKTQQRLHLRAQILVSRALSLQEIGAIFFLQVQRFLNQPVNLRLFFRLQPVCLRSFRAAATAWPISSPASPSQEKPSAPRRFHPRSIRRKNEARLPDFFWR